MVLVRDPDQHRLAVQSEVLAELEDKFSLPIYSYEACAEMLC